MRLQNNDDEKFKSLLRAAFPSADAELRRDLWPAMLRRLNTFEVAVPWYDWALVAGLTGAVIIFPKLVFFFAYHL
jgi:hypothetical protein